MKNQKLILLILTFLTSPLLLCSGIQLLSLLHVDFGLSFFSANVQVENQTIETLYLTPITTTYGDPRVIAQSGSIRQRDFPLEPQATVTLTYDSADASLAGIIVCRAQDDCRLLEGDYAAFDMDKNAMVLSVQSFDSLPELEPGWLEAKNTHSQSDYSVVIFCIIGFAPILLFGFWLRLVGQTKRSLETSA